MLPHEIFTGERDKPGEPIPLWLLIFDIQATELVAKDDAARAKG